MAAFIDDDTLRDYLAEALPAGELARVEKALRGSAELRARLEDVRANRADGHIHTLGAIWRRQRLTCMTRQQLGSFLLEALDPGLMEYLEFHLDVIGCPYCRANLQDLKLKAVEASPARPRRIFEGSHHLLGGEG
ncbi:MAG: hypothetical protein U0800_25865 [Isosphaeraceae bacterium]